jgi:hypothetical protein
MALSLFRVPVDVIGLISDDQTLEEHQPVNKPPTESSFDPKTTVCQACHYDNFESFEEMKAHFKTDWHRFNLKRRIKNQPAVSEQHFEEMDDLSKYFIA